MDFASYLVTKFDKKHLNLFKNSLPRVWRAKFGDFCVVISREFLTELAKNRLGGLACPAYAYFCFVILKISLRHSIFCALG